MGKETTQPTRIDADEYARFKQFVQDTHGQTRGHLKTEIENALREYRQPDESSEPLRRIENDVATIKAQLVEIESDGGADTLLADSHTHTPNGTPTERPDPQAASERKVRWLAECVIDAEVPKTREINSIAKKSIREVVKDEYGFRADTAERYVDELIEHFGLVPHPTADEIYVPESRRQEIIEQKREATQNSAAQKTDMITNAERGE